MDETLPKLTLRNPTWRPFSPRLTSGSAKRLCAKYKKDGDDRGAMAAGARLASAEVPAVADVEAIFEWKTRGRGRSRIKNNVAAEVRDAIKLARSAQCPRSAMAVLTGLHGVAVPVASSIMAMMQLDRHTVIDFRALETLSYEGSYGSIDFYLSYRVYCIALARLWGMTLRDLDRALWQWSSDFGTVNDGDG